MWQLSLFTFTVPLQNVLLVEDVTCQFLCMLGHIKLWCPCGWQKMAKSHLLVISCQFYWLYLSLTTAPYNRTSAPLTHQHPITRACSHTHVLFCFTEDREGTEGSLAAPGSSYQSLLRFAVSLHVTCLSMPRWGSWTARYTRTDITTAIKVTVL